MDNYTIDWNRYASLEVQDFIEDDVFRDWVKHPTPEKNQTWQGFMQEHPMQEAKILEAKKAILLLKDYFEREKKEDTAVDDFFQHRIHPQLGRTTGNSRNGFRINRFLQVAASLLLLLSLGMLWWWNSQEPLVLHYATNFGEQEKIELPDGSIVHLNANSTLDLSTDWGGAAVREVWLQGEAFFEVEKKPATKAKFIVHAEDVSVEVLGTQFNVNTRKEQTKVALKEGKITLRFSDQQREPITMRPGELVTYNNKAKNLEKRQVEAAEYSSWKDGWLFFDQARMEDVADRIEEFYGVQVIIENETLQNKTVQGGIPNEDLDAFLEALQTMYSIEIEQRGDSLILK